MHCGAAVVGMSEPLEELPIAFSASSVNDRSQTNLRPGTTIKRHPLNPKQCARHYAADLHPSFFAARQRQKCKPASRASRSLGAPRRLCNAKAANIAAGKR